MAEQNLVRRKCDFCEDTMEFLQNRSVEQISPEEAVRIAGWITLVRIHLVKGQPYQVIKHACKDSCATNIIRLEMLGLPKEIVDMLAEEKRLAEEFKKKQAQVAKEAGADFVAASPTAPIQTPGEA